MTHGRESPIRPRMVVVFAAALLIVLAAAGIVLHFVLAEREAAPTAQPPETEETMRTVVLDVEGMHCDGCVHRVGEFLRACPDVVTATVSLDANEAVVRLATEEPREKELVQAVSEAGYTATVREQ